MRANMLSDLAQDHGSLAGRAMILLAGEQPAPNLLPVRHFAPSQVIVLHTDLAQSKRSAENLAHCLVKYTEHPPLTQAVDAYSPHKVFESVSALLEHHPGASINITGGTKPMSIGALCAARAHAAPVLYIRSQGAKTEVDLYQFDEAGVPMIAATHTIGDSVTIDEYLTMYAGRQYAFTGHGNGDGEALERAVYTALEPEVDECKAGWKHQSGAVDVDLVVRCGNQIGVIEVKSGNRARTTEGIKQLAVAGGQRFMGTYVRRILVVDQNWNKASNNRMLSDALGIIRIELPDFAANRVLSAEERRRLVDGVHATLGKSADKPI